MIQYRIAIIGGKPKKEKHAHSSPKKTLKTATVKAFIFKEPDTSGALHNISLSLGDVQGEVFTAQEKHANSAPKKALKTATAKAFIFKQPNISGALHNISLSLGDVQGEVFTAQEKHAKSSPKNTIKTATAKAFIFKQPNISGALHNISLSLGDVQGEVFTAQENTPTPPRKRPSKPLLLYYPLHKAGIIGRVRYCHKVNTIRKVVHVYK